MNPIKTLLTLDVNKDATQAVVSVKIHDSSSCELCISLVKNGKQLLITDSDIAILRCGSAEVGKKIVNCTIEHSCIEVILPQINVEGLLKSEVQIYDGNGFVLTSAWFYIDVLNAAVDDYELNTDEDILDGFRGILDDIVSAKNNATISIESTKDEAVATITNTGRVETEKLVSAAEREKNILLAELQEKIDSVDHKGDKGDKGDTGAQGIQGERGEKGITGERGLQGIQGAKGDIGKDGATGERGLQGVQGPAGTGIGCLTGVPLERFDVGDPSCYLYRIHGTGIYTAIVVEVDPFNNPAHTPAAYFTLQLLFDMNIMEVEQRGCEIDTTHLFNSNVDGLIGLCAMHTSDPDFGDVVAITTRVYDSNHGTTTKRFKIVKLYKQEAT